MCVSCSCCCNVGCRRCSIPCRANRLAQSIRLTAVTYVVRYREYGQGSERIIWRTRVFLERDNAVLFMDANLKPWNKAELSAHIFDDVEDHYVEKIAHVAS